MSKSVPRPKTEDSSQYMSSLTTSYFMIIILYSEKEILQIFKGIREDKNEEALRGLIKTGKMRPEDRNKEGMDPLIFAVDCEFSLETLEFLVQNGCSVKNSDDQGRTALHYAVDLENVEIINFLVKNGADPLAKDKLDSSPLDEAEFNQEVKNALLQKQ